MSVNIHDNNKQTVVVIYGCTASGKNDLALNLAKQLNGCVINADSAQIYKEIKILNNSPSEKDYNDVEHLLFNFISLNESFSVGKWLDLAMENIFFSLQKQKIPIVVGGSGLYINSLVYGLSKLPSNIHKKQEAIDLYNNLGQEKFFNLVQQIDPIFTKTFKDKQRLIRAYEVYLISGKTISQLKNINLPIPNPKLKFYKIFINKSRNIIKNKIYTRTQDMIQKGAIEEVRSMNKQFYKKILGSYELSLYINNLISLEKSIEKIVIKTQQYAKRQTTWFKNKINSNTIIQDNNNTIQDIINSILKK